MDGLLAYKLGRSDLWGSQGAPPVGAPYADLASVSATARVPDFTGRVGLTMLLALVGGVAIFNVVARPHLR